jgi:hypothetical protein
MKTVRFLFTLVLCVYTVSCQKPIDAPNFQAELDNNVEIATLLQHHPKERLIGKKYQGGLIFYIQEPTELDSGLCLIAAPTDQADLVIWADSGSVSMKIHRNELGDGAQNTLDIISQCPSSGIAAEICLSLNINGYDDWYLPNIAEVTTFMKTLNNTTEGNITTVNHWTSNNIEKSSHKVKASAIVYSNYDTYSLPDTSFAAVRAIRKLTFK